MTKVSRLVRDNAAEYRRQLLSYAIKVCKDHDVAEDLVQHAFAKGLASDADWIDGDAIHFLTTIVAHQWFALARAKPTRGGKKGSVSLDDSEEVSRLSVAPSQIPAVEIAEVKRAFDALPQNQRTALTMAANGCENAEVGRALGVTTQHAGLVVGRARDALREATGRAKQVFAPKARYRGVRPHGNRWVAEHQSTKLGKLYLGTFGTPEEAAMAWDVAALSRQGDRANLNFPAIRQEIVARELKSA